MKRIIFTIFIFLFAYTAYAAKFTVDGINYTTTGTSKVQVSSGTYSGSITIPANVTYSDTTYSVTPVHPDMSFIK